MAEPNEETVLQDLSMFQKRRILFLFLFLLFLDFLRLGVFFFFIASFVCATLLLLCLILTSRFGFFSGEINDQMPFQVFKGTLCFDLGYNLGLGFICARNVYLISRAPPEIVPVSNIVKKYLTIAYAALSAVCFTGALIAGLILYFLKQYEEHLKIISDEEQGVHQMKINAVPMNYPVTCEPVNNMELNTMCDNKRNDYRI